MSSDQKKLFKVDEPPKGTSIQVTPITDTEFYLTWPTPKEERGRIPTLLILIAWLIFWAIIEALIFLGLAVPSDKGLIIHITCIVLWTAIGSVVASLLISLIRPAKPESITIGPDYLRHDPGSFTYADWVGPQHENVHFWKKMEVRTISRADVSDIRLYRLQDQQRLIIHLHHGTSQMEVGRNLTNRERWWLAETLRKWLQPRTSPNPTLANGLQPVLLQRQTAYLFN